MLIPKRRLASTRQTSCSNAKSAKKPLTFSPTHSWRPGQIK
jgi:hypothetical protein